MKNHKTEDCWRLAAKKKEEAKSKDKDEDDDDEAAEVVLTITEDTAMKMSAESVRISRNTYLADTGASSHMTNDDTNMYDCKKVNIPVKGANGETMRCTKIGKKPCIIKQDGRDMKVILENVMHVPELWVNLISMNKLLGAGWQLGNKGVEMFVEKKRKDNQVRQDLQDSKWKPCWTLSQEL